MAWEHHPACFDSRSSSQMTHEQSEASSVSGKGWGEICLTVFSTPEKVWENRFFQDADDM